MKNIWKSYYKNLSSLYLTTIIDIKIIGNSLVEFVFQHINTQEIQSLTVQSYTTYCKIWSKDNYWLRTLMQTLIGVQITIAWKAYRTFPWPKSSKNRIYIFDENAGTLFKISGFIVTNDNSTSVMPLHSAVPTTLTSSFTTNEIVIDLSMSSSNNDSDGY